MRTDSITASMLYDFVRCPHRVTMDLFGNPAERDPISPFVQLLWERGHAFEEDVIKGLEVPFLNLRTVPERERERRTMEAIAAGESLIYGGRIRADDLLGEPDLLRKESNGYVAGDIKSGAGLEGVSEDSDGKPKQHYAVQLALYTDILERKGVSRGHVPFVWDIHGQEVAYHLDTARGPRKPTSMWEDYESSLDKVRAIASGESRTLPALAGECKLCHWRTACLRRLEESNDLTLIPDLGRSRRDNLLAHIGSVRGLAGADLSELIKGSKTVIPGVGTDMLRRFQVRAQLQTKPDGKPYLLMDVKLPHQKLELFFDIETDPMREICYLYGFLERRGGDIATEKYVPFFAKEPSQEAEKDAFAKAWGYIREMKSTTIYFYTKYERTILRELTRCHPDVATEDDIEELFVSEAAVDLYYDIVKPKMEWPTRDLSIKTLASFLGFKWRDTDPSGASSVEWYHKWVETGDPEIKRRIMDYNEDDCRAMRILADAIRGMVPQAWPIQ
ncbi:MAG: TM0106 family RecB-like putative nuclease [Desulfobacterales bacterium]|nr:TM0106 family RecB-like putative nuclease [Desulfobacterales bacterium]